MSLFTLWNAFSHFSGLIYSVWCFRSNPSVAQTTTAAINLILFCLLIHTVEVKEWISSCNWPMSAQLTNVAVDWKHVHNKATTSRERERARERERVEGGRSQTEMKCHLSPFKWCLTMTSFALAGPSPMGKEVWCTDCCSWLWLPGDRLPIPHSTVLCAQKSKSLCRKIKKISNMTCE